MIANTGRKPHTAKRGLIAAAALAVLAPLGVASAAQVTITYLGYPGHGKVWNDYVKARIADYEKAHPDVKIDYLTGERGGNYAQGYLTLVAGGEAPDITEMTLSAGGTLQAGGYFLDLNPLLKADATLTSGAFPPAVIGAVTRSNGELWGLPWSVYDTTSTFNKDLFAEAGLATPDQLGDGWNWQYVINAGKKLTRDTNNDRVPDVWGVDDPYGGMLGYMQPVEQAGGSLFDRLVDPTKANFTDERTLQGLNWYADMYKQGIADPKMGAGHYQAGGAAMYFTAGLAWLTKTAMPKTTFESGSAPPPMGPANNAGYIAINSLQIGRNSKHPQAAWDFIKYLAGSKASVEQLVKATGVIPAYAAVGPEYATLIGQPPALVQPFIDVITNPNSYHDAIGNGARDAMDLIVDTFQSKVITGGAPVKPTLESITPQVNALLAKGGAKQ